MHLNRSRRHESGVAMLLALMTLLLVGGIATLLFTRSLNEMKHSADDTAIVQTLMLARGGANMGGALLSTDVHYAFRDIVEVTATPGRWAFGDGTAGTDAPEPGSTSTQLAAAAAQLQSAVDGMVCGESFMPEDGTGSVDLRIYFTTEACGVLLPDEITLPNGRFVEGPPRGGVTDSEDAMQEYSIPFVMISEAALGDYRRNIVTQGEYRFWVGQSSFARYAYFTNRDSTTSSQIWFTDDTMIDGPVHTNGHFAFYRDPWFGGAVTSAGCTSSSSNTEACQGQTRPGAFFYDRPSTRRSLADMQPDVENPVFGENRPRFEDGVSWEATYVPLPQNAFDQQAVALGDGGRPDVGIHLAGNLASLDLWAGDEFGNTADIASINGDDDVTWDSEATHQYVRACQPGSGGSCETWRIDSGKRLEKLAPGSDFSDPSTWVWEEDDRPFNGVIYTAGKVDRFRGPERKTSTVNGRQPPNDGRAAPAALAAFSELTVVAEDNIRLTGDLTYEQPPCTGVPTRNQNRTVNRPECGNLNHKNVLGVYTPGGDVIVGNDNNDPSLNAPYDMHMHGVLMSASNQIRVEGYKEKGSYSRDRGSFYLMGGMIQENRGVFGTFQAGSGASGRRGYDRVYTYDVRMKQGVAPPYFPTTGLDTVDAVRVFSFGQREQVY